MLGHVDQLHGLGGQALRGLQNGTGLALKGEHGAVVVAVRGDLHQVDGVAGQHGVADLVDQTLVSALAEIHFCH